MLKIVTIRKLEFYTIPAVMYFLAYLLSRLFGYRNVDIRWELLQLLDKEALINAPLQSLYLLHSQPPLLNALLALLLKLSAILGLRSELLATILFVLLGLISTILLFHIIFEMTNSLTFAVVSIVLTLTDPAYYFFQYFYFYPFILHFLLIVFFYIVLKLLNTGNHIMLTLSVWLLALICNTRSLFHPLWAIVIYAMLLAMIFLIRSKQNVFKMRKIITSTILLLFLILVWPLKNYVLFDQFTYSSWVGFNLARYTGVHSPILNEYFSSGTVPEEIMIEVLEFQQKHNILDSEIGVIAKSEKTYGSPNWNHYIFLEFNESLQKEAVDYKIANPKKWIASSFSNYFAWARPSITQPYFGNLMGPSDQFHTKYTAFHSSLFFYDIRPFLEQNISLLAERRNFFIGNIRMPITIFSVLIFPLIMFV